ncbi:MAG: DUF4391 domain-containing protein [Bacteroidaceae bacterium]|nr:DUF4391 domain-containing protein [Bacteroidaceae bacterium]
MFQLPQATVINKPLYKKAVFEKFNLKAAERDRFDADISKMALVARVSTATVPALKEGAEIKGFYILQVILKHREYDAKNILILNKLIPQKIVFALQYENETQLCVFHTRLQQSDWQPTETATIPLQGLTLDDVWNNIVATIGKLDATAEESIEEQIVNREQREKILRQIEILEKQCRTEKQTRRKYELYKEIVELKKNLI